MVRQAELRTKITKMWRELPKVEKDKYKAMAEKMQAATMSCKCSPVKLASTDDFNKKMRKLEQSAAELARCIGTKVCVMTIAGTLVGPKKIRNHYSFAAASDGRGDLDTSVSADDVIKQHRHNQERVKSAQLFSKFKMSSGDQPIQMVCTPTECALIQVRRQRQWSEALDYFKKTAKTVGNNTDQDNNPSISPMRQMFDLSLSNRHSNGLLQRLPQPQTQQSALFNPPTIRSTMSNNLFPNLHNNSALGASLLTAQRCDTSAISERDSLDVMSLLKNQTIAVK